MNVMSDPRWLTANLRFEKAIREANILPHNARIQAMKSANRSLRAATAAIVRWSK